MVTHPLYSLVSNTPGGGLVLCKGHSVHLTTSAVITPLGTAVSVARRSSGLGLGVTYLGPSRDGDIMNQIRHDVVPPWWLGRFLLTGHGSM
jgi:hypothetical protein